MAFPARLQQLLNESTSATINKCLKPISVSIREAYYLRCPRPKGITILNK